MATINRTTGNEKQNFKSIEGGSWSSIYLPAICAGVVMTIVLLMAVSCSKKADNPAAKISAPVVAPAVEGPATTTASAAAAEPPKKAAKKTRPTNATYVNGVYGVSFSYPRKYSLQAKAKREEMPVQPAFAKPGAVELVSVDMPDTGYPDTDFSSALLNVSINPDMTANECAQFAGTPESAAKTQAVQPQTVKLGSNEFTEVEQMAGTGEKQSDLKYFHAFKNGACYEFALDVETSRKPDEELAQVDRGKVFQQLERILRTAKIKDVELAGIESAEQRSASAPVTTTPAQPVITTEQTEKAQVVTPEPK